MRIVWYSFGEPPEAFMRVQRAACLSILLFSSNAFAQSAPAAREVTVKAPDGVELKATYYAAPQPGPAVLLLHMCNTTRRSWDPLAPQLAAAGIHALSVDYRGFGESGGDRFDSLAPQDAQRVIDQKWPGDIDAAYDFLVSQPGIDRTRVGAAGGSCGVTQAVRLAGRHREVRSLALLAGPLDPDGIAFVTSTPWLPIFAAAAADDQYDAGAPQLMQWILTLSGNPRNKFSGFKDGKHGTEIFGPHPELVKQMVAWYADTLVKRPADPASAETVKTNPVREFWRKATSPTGVNEAVQMFYDVSQSGRRIALFPEGAMNQLGYSHLQAGRTAEAVRLFRLNTLAYPTSANTYDSLADAYLANGQNELALRMSEKALELLPKDRSTEERKNAIRESAEQKIAKLKGEVKK
jgi:dienelactone hydrolase